MLSVIFGFGTIIYKGGLYVYGRGSTLECYTCSAREGAIMHNRVDYLSWEGWLSNTKLILWYILLE